MQLKWFDLAMIVTVIAVIVVVGWPRQGAKGGSRLANTLNVGLNVVRSRNANGWRNVVALFYQWWI